MRLRGYRGALLALSALALPALAHAQMQASDASAAGIAAPSASLADEPAAGPPLTADEADTLGKALMFDPESLTASTPAKKLKLPTLSEPHDFAVTKSERPDGSSTVTLKQTLPSTWSADVGADLNMGPAPATTFQPGQPLAETNGSNSGAAWASVGVKDFATVNARVDPTNDRGRLGTTLQHSVPVGDKLKVTLQDTYSVTESLGDPAATSPAAPAGLPLMALPRTNGSASAPEIFGSNQQTIKFDILPTGTSLAATLNSSSTDPVTHKTLSADQKLLGPVHVTTAVTDAGEPNASKSITAGVKLNW